ncbi:Eukaryotic translation initiation factor 3 subunit C [Sparganum proliferum]
MVHWQQLILLVSTVDTLNRPITFSPHSTSPAPLHGMSLHLFSAAFSSSESESDDDVPVKPVQHRFMQPHSDSEDEKRVVRSAKDKRQEEIRNVLRNFEELVKLYEKALKLNEIEKNANFYIRCLTQLEDFINESWEQKKSLSKVAAKSLTIMRQRVKKENPELYEEEEEELAEEAEEAELESSDKDDDDEEEVSTKPAPVAAAPTKKAAKDSDESSDDFPSEDESSEWSSDEDDDIANFDDPASYFLKQDHRRGTKDDVKAKKASKQQKQPKQSRTVREEGDEEEEEGEWRTVDASGRAEPAVQAFEKGIEITAEVVLKKLLEILSNRGKRTSSINEQVSLLQQICEKLEELQLGVGLHVKAILSTITVLFDYESKHPAFMPVNKFQRVVDEFNTLFGILKENRKDVTISDTYTEETESLLVKPYRVQGNLLAAVGRLDDEHYKILQNANGHDKEYDERLRDEPRVCDLLDKLIEYLEYTAAPPDALCVAYMRRVEHLYYKYDYEWARRVEAEGAEAVGPNAAYPVIERLCQYIYKNDKTDRLRARAILCHIYFLALFDHWYKARDLMLMSNLQASIDHADQSTMILYNRAMVQMGLCAFRQGHIRDAHSTLSDITGSGRIRELLAQTLHLQPRYERTPEEEKREKALQVPYHMHINTELVECIYLISAMIQEMPALAASQDNENRTRPFSKAFMSALKMHERATLTGPPESPRDHVIAASKAMRTGNWKACLNYIFNPKLDAKIWILFSNVGKIREILEARIKEECLRCYLFTFSSVHESISLARLAEHFELPKSQVYSIISKMIINQELAGSLEVPADFLTMHKGERSRLQSLALQLADKINSIVDMNEKLVENRGGLIAGGKGLQSMQGPRRQRLVQAPKFI